MLVRMTAVLLSANLSASMTVAQPAENAITLQSDGLRLEIGADGQIESLQSRASRTEYLPDGAAAPLLVVRVDGQEFAPTAVSPGDEVGLIDVALDAPGVTVTVRAREATTHIVFECVAVTGPTPELVFWGNIPTTIDETIGETVGVVRDGEFALGIQGLNAKTIGGASAMGDAGSRLYAMTREAEGGVVGSAIALFGCPPAEALATIGEIELAEDLPHPMLDGVWGKISPRATESYLISPFGEASMPAVIARAKAAGFRYIYHPGPFRTWGHFELNPDQFPDGDASLRRCADMADEAGMRLGIHTLTAFITTNDPYVTPVPDPRLARWGTTALTKAIDAEASEIAIDDPEAFDKQKTLKSAIIGEEIIQYDGLSDAAPWRLLGCKRGKFGTTPSAHEAGADIGNLADHGYRTLYPGIGNGMWSEMADRLVEVCNAGRIRQISFDGLEGLSTYGYNEWPRNIFVERCYEGWENETISDASNLLHYLWHIHTRMNWGEPWGQAMRDGMPEYRFKNQDYFERNLFPKMLGWFQLRLGGGGIEATDLDDVEWVLSKAAAHDAGFAIASSLPEMDGNGQSQAILAAIREWESARAARAFGPELRERLKDAGTDWHLEPAGEGRWELSPVKLARFACSSEALQPGQPVENAWELANPYGKQPLHLTLRVPFDAATPAETPTVSIGGTEVAFATTLSAGQHLVCDGSREAKVYDANWVEIGVAEADTDPPMVDAGPQGIEFVAPSMTGAPPAVELVVRLAGEAQIIAP